MDISRLESLIASGAHVKTFAKKDMARVSVKLPDGHEYSATGHSFDIAMDRVMSKIDSRAKDVKQSRRRKERERQEIIDAMGEDPICSVDEWH